MLRLERDYITAQLASIAQMLETMPEDDYLGGVGFEAQREELEQQLEAVLFNPNMRAQIALYFGGEPVIGSTGIEATFGTKVVGTFQDLVTKVWSTIDAAPLQQMGSVKDKEEAQLHITTVVHGSFGFVLEELDNTEPMFPTPLSKAAGQVADYMLNFAGESDASFSPLIDTLNSRVFLAMKTFFSYMYNAKATFRLVEGERDQQFDHHAVERAWYRARASEVLEDRIEVFGRLLGVIPMKGRFELELDNTAIVIEGKVGEKFSRRYLERIQTEQIAGLRYKALVNKRTVTKIGKDPSDSYTLLDLHQIEGGK